jgi:hypothetical protein
VTDLVSLGCSGCLLCGGVWWFGDEMNDAWWLLGEREGSRCEERGGLKYGDGGCGFLAGVMITIGDGGLDENGDAIVWVCCWLATVVCVWVLSSG